MFPRTVVSEKTAKNPLTCSHVQMVYKIANRHQFHQLEPRRVRGTADERKTLSIPAKDKHILKRCNEKAVRNRLQVM